MTNTRTKFTTPIGRAVWPRLNDADRRFKAEGEYKIDLRLNKSDPGVAEMLAELEAELKTHIEESRAAAKKAKKPFELKNPPWAVVKDDNGEETGEIDLKFRMAASVKGKDGKLGFEQKPALFDSKGTPTTARVGGGSRVRVQGVVNKWSTPLGCSMSLWLKGVQIIELRGPGGDASYFGFEPVEDGFVAAPEGATAPAGEKTADEDGDF